MAEEGGSPAPGDAPGAGRAGPARGWRLLGGFWLLVLLLLAGLGGTLHRLGPPPAPPPAPVAEAAPAMTAGPPALPPAGPETAEAAAVPAETATVAAEPQAAEPVAAEARMAETQPAPAMEPEPEPPTPAEAPSPGSPSPGAPAPVAAADAPVPMPVASVPPPPAAPAPPPLAPPRPVAQVQAAPIPPPDPALLEPTPYGPVPRVGADGRTSIRTYARAFARDDTRPRVGLVVGGLGLNAALSEEAIRRLPPTVGLVFSPYAARPEPLAERARARGMELLVGLPLEPSGYPLNDPGERALLTTLPPAENMNRLLWSLSRVQGQVGAVGALGPMRGERFAQVPGLLAMVQEALRERGLLYIDPRPAPPPGAPARAYGRNAEVVLDEPATRGEIERRLEELERLARERGSALGIAGEASPVLVDRVAAWAGGLESRGLVLAPVTALIRRPEGRPEPRGELRPASAGEGRPEAHPEVSAR